MAARKSGGYYVFADEKSCQSINNGKEIPYQKVYY